MRGLILSVLVLSLHLAADEPTATNPASASAPAADSSSPLAAGPIANIPGVCSYTAPTSWHLKETPISKYPFAFATPKGQFADNISLVVDPTPGTLQDYASHLKDQLVATKIFSNISVSPAQPFVTATGDQGLVETVSDAMGALTIIQRFYLFEGTPGSKLIVTCTATADDAPGLAPTFDAVMKTLVIAHAALPAPPEPVAGSAVNAPGLFTYTPPPGWQVKLTQFSKYPVAFAPAAGAFRPNIAVTVETAHATLEEYAAASRRAIQAMPLFTNVVFSPNQPFTTTAGVKGLQISINDTMGKLDVVQRFYLFPTTGDVKLAVVCTCQPSDAAALAPVFDTAMKTFAPQ
jgi:hypothetical protein